MYSNVSQTGVWERSPQPPVGDFCKFLEKKAILILLDHISHMFKAISKNLTFNIWKPIQKI